MPQNTTPEAVDRFTPDALAGGITPVMRPAISGKFIRYSVYAALSAQLEDANKRADLPPTPEQIMADPRVQALVEALKECRDDLDGYSQNEYPADHPVHIRYRKRDYDANPARIALAAIKEQKP